MCARDYRAEVVAGIEASLSSVCAQRVDALTREIGSAERIFFAAAGRSFLMIKALAMALMQIGYRVHAVGDVSTPGVARGDLLIVASSSGETPSVLLFIEQARAGGAKVALITSSPGSSMAQAADLVVEMSDGVERGSPQAGWTTGSFFELALAPLGDCIVETLAAANGASRESVHGNHANLE